MAPLIMRLGVMASGAGTTLQAVLDARARGELAADVVIVISNNGSSGALARARAAGVPTRHLSSATHPDPMALDRAIRDALREHAVDLVLLAGYMKKLGPETLAAFDGRIINTHPALLPSFGGQGMFGMRVHEAVIRAGVPRTGVTIHWVEAEYDTGPVIAQAELDVLPGDTPESLASRVQSLERAFLVNVLAEFASGARPLPAKRG